MSPNNTLVFADRCWCQIANIGENMTLIDSGNCKPQVRLVYGSDPLGHIWAFILRIRWICHQSVVQSRQWISIVYKQIASIWTVDTPTQCRSLDRSLDGSKGGGREWIWSRLSMIARDNQGYRDAPPARSQSFTVVGVWIATEPSYPIYLIKSALQIFDRCCNKAP